MLGACSLCMQTNNCYNPFVGRVVGDLASVQSVPVITGCIPQATFYTLLNQWLAETGQNNNIIRDKNGKIVTSKMPVMHIAKGDDDKYESRALNNVRDVEKDINDQLFGGNHGTEGSYAAFIYGENYVFYSGIQMLPRQSLVYFILALVGGCSAAASYVHDEC